MSHFSTRFVEFIIDTCTSQVKSLYAFLAVVYAAVCVASGSLVVGQDIVLAEAYIQNLTSNQPPRVLGAFVDYRDKSVNNNFTLIVSTNQNKEHVYINTAEAELAVQNGPEGLVLWFWYEGLGSEGLSIPVMHDRIMLVKQDDRLLVFSDGLLVKSSVLADPQAQMPIASSSPLLEFYPRAIGATELEQFYNHHNKQTPLNAQ